MFARPSSSMNTRAKSAPFPCFEDVDHRAGLGLSFPQQTHRHRVAAKRVRIGLGDQLVNHPHGRVAAGGVAHLNE